ncbi:MAG: SH3 domain-containing protein [Saprospiraceae bacterium]|nr:SH3 domain-containing protein [Saprospiraceae bacterium]
MSRLTLFFFLFLTSKILAADAQQLFQNANQAYQTGNFTLAVEQYETILRGGKLFSKELYYNLGNGYFRLNQTGRSVLNYERAARLAPTDTDIQTNLLVVRGRVTDDIEAVSEVFFVKWYRLLRSAFMADTWAVFGLFFLWLACGAFAVWLLGTQRVWKKRGFVVGCVALPLSLLTLLMTDNATKINEATFGIVMSKETVFRNAPNESAAVTATLHEGVKVELLDRIGGLSKVKLANGEEGWINATDVEKI